jgi:glutamine cyclotransferase
MYLKDLGVFLTRILFFYLFSSQGLTYANGLLFESTGLYGQSSVRILDPDTAEVKKSVPMDNMLFGEGMAFVNETLVQITWKKKRGFVYDAKTLATIREFKYTTTLNEGWGITWDACNNEYIVTDGSEFLHFWDPETMMDKKPKVAVTRMDGSPAKELNEIEFWRGRVLANVWFEDVLLVIHPGKYHSIVEMR